MNKINELFQLNENDFLEELKIISSSFDIFSFEKSVSKSNFENFFKKYSDLDSVTFFGGSFNPIHLGHLECIKLCPEKNILMVLDRNPQKDLRNLDLKNELQLIVNRLQNLDVSLYPGFWLKSEKNPTNVWIQKVMAQEKNLLMGDDSFINFFSWQKPEVILMNLKKIYVVPRNHQLHQLMIVKEQCEQINPQIEVVFLSNHLYQHLSSTELRK